MTKNEPSEWEKVIANEDYQLFQYRGTVGTVAVKQKVNSFEI